MMIKERYSVILSEISFLKLSSFCLKVFILILPFQIRTLIFNPPYLASGNFNEFATYFIYAGDILILMAGILFGLAIYKKETDKILTGEFVLTFLTLLYVLSLIFSIFVAEEKMFVLFQSFRYLEFIILYFLIVNEVIGREDTMKFFIYALLIQSFIAIEQYFFQSSVGLGVFGEPLIGSEVPGVAKMDIGAGKMIRAYGTFLHPNFLSGFLVIALLWVYHNYKKNMWLYLIVASVLLMALIFTF